MYQYTDTGSVTVICPLNAAHVALLPEVMPKVLYFRAFHCCVTLLQSELPSVWAEQA